MKISRHDWLLGSLYVIRTHIIISNIQLQGGYYYRRPVDAVSGHSTPVIVLPLVRSSVMSCPVKIPSKSRFLYFQRIFAVLLSIKAAEISLSGTIIYLTHTRYTIYPLTPLLWSLPHSSLSSILIFSFLYPLQHPPLALFLCTAVQINLSTADVCSKPLPCRLIILYGYLKKSTKDYKFFCH